MVEKCKHCSNPKLLNVTKEVNTLDEEDVIDVTGQVCENCNCFHYKLDGLPIYEYLTQSIKDTFDNAKMLKSDYDLAQETAKNK